MASGFETTSIVPTLCQAPSVYLTSSHNQSISSICYSVMHHTLEPVLHRMLP